MQRLSPQIAALKEKYKEDKQRQQQEIMAFYRENKINPLASCLPLLLAAAGVRLAVLHAAHGSEARHLRRAAARTLLPGARQDDHAQQRNPLGRDHARRAAHQGPLGNQLQRGGAALGEVPVPPGHHRKGDGRGVDRADRPVRRLAGLLDARRDGLGGPQPAPPDAAAAGRVRGDPLPLPGRPAGLLDHDERVDDRPAVPDQTTYGTAADTGRGGRFEERQVDANAQAGAGRCGRRRSDSPASTSSPGLLGRLAGAGASRPQPEAKPKPSAPPPRSPRSKKKKRSGRRR